MSEVPETGFRFDGSADAPLTLALAHGAGVAMDSPIMSAFATGLADRGHRVARFEFPYMAAQGADGRKRPPDREEALKTTWRSVIDIPGKEHDEPSRLAIGAIAEFLTGLGHDR